MIINLSPYWTYPPTGGGPNRIYNLNKNLSDIGHFIIQISFRPPYAMKNKYGVKSLLYSRKKIVLSKNYIEYQLSDPFYLFSSLVSYKLFSNPDILTRSSTLGTLLHKNVFSFFSNAKIIQVEHPWLFNMARKYNRKDVPIFLSTHNCEAKLLKNMNKKRFDKSVKIERDAIKNADVIFAVSENDVNDFENILNIDIKSKEVYIVPNGVDTTKIKFTTYEEKERAKIELGFKKKKVLLFVGSIHEPNVEAVREIIKMAEGFDNSYLFLIVGSVGEFFKGAKLPSNVIFTGFIDDPRLYLKSADIALNPISFGSGSSLKMLEYLALGLPTISTPVGARGLKITNGKHAVIADISEFKYWIEEIFENPSFSSKLSKNGREIVEKYYDWRSICKIVSDVYKKYTGA